MAVERRMYHIVTPAAGVKSTIVSGSFFDLCFVLFWFWFVFFLEWFYSSRFYSTLLLYQKGDVALVQQFLLKMARMLAPL